MPTLCQAYHNYQFMSALHNLTWQVPTPLQVVKNKETEAPKIKALLSLLENLTPEPKQRQMGGFLLMLTPHTFMLHYNTHMPTPSLRQ